MENLNLATFSFFMVKIFWFVNSSFSTKCEFNQTRNEIIRKPVIKIAAYTVPMFVEECCVDYPQNCSNPGFEVKLIYEILTSFGKSVFQFTCTVQSTLHRLGKHRSMLSGSHL